jgi:hypothetical protein
MDFLGRLAARAIGAGGPDRFLPSGGRPAIAPPALGPRLDAMPGDAAESGFRLPPGARTDETPGPAASPGDPPRSHGDESRDGEVLRSPGRADESSSRAPLPRSDVRPAAPAMMPAVHHLRVETESSSTGQVSGPTGSPVHGTSPLVHLREPQGKSRPQSALVPLSLPAAEGSTQTAGKLPVTAAPEDSGAPVGAEPSLDQAPAPVPAPGSPAPTPPSRVAQTAAPPLSRRPALARSAGAPTASELSRVGAPSAAWPDPGGIAPRSDPWLPAARATPRHHPGLAPASAPAETVVRVTIGRVEVRAETPSTAAPQTSPLPDRRLGLDEYLRRRAGG